MSLGKLNGTSDSDINKVISKELSSLDSVMGVGIESGGPEYTLYIDGEEVSTDTSQSAITSPVTMYGFGMLTNHAPSSGNDYHAIIDNCFACNNIDTDLYALADYTENVPGRGDYIMFWWRCDGNTGYEAVWNNDFDYGSGIGGENTITVIGDSIVNLANTSSTTYKSASRAAQIAATNYNNDGPSSVMVYGLGNLPSNKGRIGCWVRLPDTGNAHDIGYTIGLGAFGYIDEEETQFRQAMIALIFTPGTYPDVAISAIAIDLVNNVPNYYVAPSISGNISYGTWYFIELAYNLTGE